MDNSETKFILGLVNKKITSSTKIYNHIENYDYKEEVLNEGKYWMGSQTSNTMCNQFTIFGADKKHADDTKEKK